MTRFGWAVVLSTLAVLVIVISAGTYFYKKGVNSEAPAGLPIETVATTTDPTSLELYSSGDYGFSLAYPKGTLTASENTSTSSTAINKKVTELKVVEINLSDASLSVRVSSTSANILSCTKVRPSETAMASTTFGGANWNVFSRDDLGTDAEFHDTSYRTVHEGACVTLLAQQPYIGGVVMIRQDLATIVESFSFARP